MKKVLFYVSENQFKSENLKKARAKLCSQGILADVALSSDEAAVSDMFGSIDESASSDVLVLSDREFVLRQACQLGIACIALDCGEFPEDDLWCTSSAITDLSDADPVWLDRCYRRFHDLPWTIAETEHLILREITEDDLPSLALLMKESSTAKWVTPAWTDLTEGLIYEKAYRREMYGFYQFGLWGVFLKETGEMIGRVGLETRTGFKEPELGYLIGEKYREQGYCLEACNAALSYARDELSFPCVHCFIEADNFASKAAAEKLGFTPSDTPSFIEQEGRKLIHYMYLFL